MKITRPRMASISFRERLFRRIDANRMHPVVWIAGPAGSGKTCTVSSYIQQRKLSNLWYKADENDADAATVFYYLRLAAKTASSRKKIRLPLFSPEYALGLPAFTKRFFEILFGALTKPSILVFDDFQAADGRVLSEIIQNAIPVIPEGINLIVLSRIKPPPSMARAMANREMHLIGWRDLQLSRDETALFIKDVYRKDFSPRMVDQLHVKADGWIAGLILLLTQPDVQKSQPQPVSPDTPEVIFDYFASEVFENAPDDIRRFLLATSFLSRMTATMARSLTGHAESGKILDRLYSENFFTLKHGGNTASYRYHALFREFLRARAKASLPASTLSELKNKAASLLESSGQIEDAVALYRDSNNHRESVDLIQRNAPDLLEQGRHQTLEGWIINLPSAIVDSDPWLQHWLGCCRLPFNAARSRPLFENALSLFEDRKDPRGIFLALSGVFQSVAYALDGFVSFDRWIPKLESYRQEYPSFHSPQEEAVITSSMLGALMLRQCNHPEFASWEKRALELVGKGISLPLKMQLLIPIGLSRIFSGQLAEAERIIEIFRALITDGTVPPMVRITLREAEAFFYWLTGEFDACKNACLEALDLADATGVHILSFLVRGQYAAGMLSSGNTGEADLILKAMEMALSRVGSWDRQFYHTLCLWRALLADDAAQAEAQSKLALDFAEMTGMPQTMAIAYWGRAIVLHMTENDPEALHMLDEALALSRRFGARQVQFGCLMTKAKVAFDRKAEPTGIRTLRQALSIGSLSAHVNTYFWRSDEMAELCGKALEAGTHEAFVRKLIRKRHLAPDESHLTLENWPWPIQIFTLGGFGIRANGIPLPFKGKAPRKPISFLKALIAFGGREVLEDLLLDSLWPEQDGDSAHSAYTSCLYRLRKLLGSEEVVRVYEGKVSLDHRVCWVDLWPYERMLNRAEACWLESGDEEKRSRAARFTEEIMSQNKGGFLPGDASPWIIRIRERLKNKYLGCIRYLVRYYEESREWNKANSAYAAGISVDPLSEDLYRGLMGCHHRLGNRSQIISTYRFCEMNLSTHAGLTPSEETAAFYRSLL